MERRGGNRLPRRLTCEIETSGGRATGIVRDLSSHGLFVQTLASPAPNSIVELIFAGSGDQPPVRIEAGVARKRRAPGRLQATVPSGIGVEVIPPRDAYQRWIVGAAAGATRTLGPARPVPSLGSVELTPVMKKYRFRLVRLDGSRQQFMSIECDTEAGARARALARVGAGWKIADLCRG